MPGSTRTREGHSKVNGAAKRVKRCVAAGSAEHYGPRPNRCASWLRAPPKTEAEPNRREARLKYHPLGENGGK